MYILHTIAEFKNFCILYMQFSAGYVGGGEYGEVAKRKRTRREKRGNIDG
jgi:hypothetical protein